jgi:uncharacterized protein YecE (DUF72 family)
MPATQLYIGTSGWGYPSWKPDFYPKSVKSKEFLRHYATLLNSTEVNYTFRRHLTEKVIEQWLADTPAEFRFALKANQYLTHIRRLKDTEESLKRFITSIEPMANSRRMGPLFFQLPPNFKADVPLLRDFLASLPKIPTAWEFRHQSWFADETYKALSDHNAALCIAENEEMQTPDVVTAPHAYYRYRKPAYTPDELTRIAEHLMKLSQSHDVYAFFKHEEDPKSATWAIDVFKMATG